MFLLHQADVTEGQGQFQVEEISEVGLVNFLRNNLFDSHELVSVANARIGYVRLLRLVREESVEGALVGGGILERVPEEFKRSNFFATPHLQ